MHSHALVSMPREQLSTANAVYTLSEEKFDLLQPEGLPAFKPASGAVEATMKALAELKGVVDNHLKVPYRCRGDRNEPRLHMAWRNCSRRRVRLRTAPRARPAQPNRRGFRHWQRIAARSP